MDAWLDNFSYQVTIGPMAFIVAGLALAMIAWVTLSYFTVKAANLNPVETLKSE